MLQLSRSLSLVSAHFPAEAKTKPHSMGPQAGLTVSDLRKTQWAGKAGHCRSGLHVTPQSRHSPRPHGAAQHLPRSGCCSAGC